MTVLILSRYSLCYGDCTQIKQNLSTAYSLLSMDDYFYSNVREALQVTIYFTLLELQKSSLEKSSYKAA